jgi:hypothetical protein
MSMLTALSLLTALAFGLALFVFDYFFTRYMGKEDTEYLAAVMREINTVESAPVKAKTRSAGAA